MPASEDWRKHPLFYYDDGNLVLLLQGVLFNVHRSIIAQHSTMFRDMLSLPQVPTVHKDTASAAKEPDPIPEGTAGNPLLIPGVSAASFSRIIAHIYGLSYLIPPIDSRLLDAKEIVELFHAADILQCDDMLSKLAETLLDTLPPLRKLAVCITIDFDGAQQRRIEAQSRVRSAWDQFHTTRTAGLPESDDELYLRSLPSTLPPPSPPPAHPETFVFRAFLAVVHDLAIQYPFQDDQGVITDILRASILEARRRVQLARTNRLISHIPKIRAHFEPDPRCIGLALVLQQAPQYSYTESPWDGSVLTCDDTKSIGMCHVRRQWMPSWTEEAAIVAAVWCGPSVDST
ncbi:hypothetical protein BKA62DRAFT_833472 [Auriculariales sp. MPI-PUGE-AT-0066]|nr:hypothetical protein BKA62DRAFT_833472 [Auriculariales sp. MPI-PUGE-AT-0066]